MNCDESIERLPWALNGTLEEGEHDEVRRHLATCPQCRAALDDTREAWTIFDQHLPGETLVALAYGEAPQGTDAALAERHLDSCPQCAADLELARLSRRLEEDDKVALFPGKRAPKAEVTREGSRTWRAAALAASFASLVAASGWFFELQHAGDLTEQLAQKPAAVQESRPAASAPAPAGPSHPDVSAQQLAALQQQVETLTRQYKEAQGAIEQAGTQVAELRRAALEPEINTLTAVGPDIVRDTAPSKEIPLPVDGPALLTLPADSRGAVRTVELVDGGGQVLWTRAGLRGDKDLEYKITFHAGFLKPGRYTLRLYETTGGPRVLRESYPLKAE